LNGCDIRIDQPWDSDQTAGIGNRRKAGLPGMAPHLSIAGNALALFIKAQKLGVSGLAGTMNVNLVKLARGLGCEKVELLKAIKSFPMLVYQNPERLLRALATGAKALGNEKLVPDADL
jgi:hypothetical protein